MPKCSLRTPRFCTGKHAAPPTGRACLGLSSQQQSHTPQRNCSLHQPRNAYCPGLLHTATGACTTGGCFEEVDCTVRGCPSTEHYLVRQPVLMPEQTSENRKPPAFSPRQIRFRYLRTVSHHSISQGLMVQGTATYLLKFLRTGC